MPELSKPSVTIRRVLSTDAKRGTDILSVLTGHLKEHTPYYPAIGRWIKDKVIPGISSGQRIGYVGFQEEEPVLAAILKQGKSSKFCHLSINERFQGNHLGKLMFSLMAAEIRSIASEVHFTLPEGLWAQEQDFFKMYGFDEAVPANIQYRMIEEELRCSTPFSVLWRNVVANLPQLLTSSAVGGFDLNDGIVLSVRDKHARAILRGEKTIEVRRRFSERWVSRKATVYASGGSQSLLGAVTIGAVTKATPDEIWLQHHEELQCSRVEFDQYVGGRSEVFGLLLVDPQPYDEALPLSQLCHLIGEELHPPQSYSVHSTTDTWARAISVAALLHGRKTGRALSVQAEAMGHKSESLTLRSDDILPLESLDKRNSRDRQPISFDECDVPGNQTNLFADSC